MTDLKVLQAEHDALVELVLQATGMRSNDLVSDIAALIRVYLALKHGADFSVNTVIALLATVEEALDGRAYAAQYKGEYLLQKDGDLDAIARLRRVLDHIGTEAP